MTAVRCEGLGKRYRLGSSRVYKSLRESIMLAASRPFRRRARREEIWALREVSLEIAAGEVVGVIGRNGAGKSTLLKILTRITEPTEGTVRLRGRVGSLLEVGTGFHSELTGRENIFLSGAILGMRRREILKKFDEIVAFAEVERFLDTPVKHYSSGMFLRLGFAVAAHLDPDILLVDEVLAVGDSAFQKKCLGKIGDVGRGGRTVIFVSHDEGAVRRLCGRTALLEQGHLTFFGSTSEAFAAYRATRSERDFSARHRTVSSPVARIVEAFLSLDGSVSSELAAGQQPILTVELEVSERARCSLEVLVRDETMLPVLFCPLGLMGHGEANLEPGTYRQSVRLNLPRLACGGYSLDLMLAETGVRFLDSVEQALRMVVVPTADPGTGWVFRQSRGQGPVLLEVEPLGSPEPVGPSRPGVVAGRSVG